MAQHLCIVSRDNPLLLGYLNIALDYLTRAGDELEIVIDRRPDPGDDTAPAAAVDIEQRRLQGVESLLRTRGYAIVSRDEGEGWRLTNAPPPEADEDAAAGVRDVVAPVAAAVRVPLRRGLLLAAGAAGVVIVAASVAISSDALERVAGAAGDAVAWLRSAPAPDAPAPAARVAPPARAPAPAASAPAAPVKVVPREPTRTAELVPPPVTSDAPSRAARAPDTPTSTPANTPTGAAMPGPAPATGPARLAKLAAPPAPPQPAASQPARRAVETAPPKPAAKPPVKTEAKPAPKPEAKVEAKTEAKPEPRKTATAAAATTVSETPPEFSGVPRLEMRRERDASGRTAAITVRVTDAGGRPLPSADVRILRRLVGGGIEETRLESVAADGSYRGRFPAPSPSSDGLSMRITVGRVSHEVPLAE